MGGVWLQGPHVVEGDHLTVTALDVSLLIQFVLLVPIACYRFPVLLAADSPHSVHDGARASLLASLAAEAPPSAKRRPLLRTLQLLCSLALAAEYLILVCLTTEAPPYAATKLSLCCWLTASAAWVLCAMLMVAHHRAGRNISRSLRWWCILNLFLGVARAQTDGTFLLERSGDGDLPRDAAGAIHRIAAVR